MKTHQPLLSIICPAYNHQEFIAQTLDGFVSQKTTFPFEIIIHDDASTDNSVKIIKEYEEKFPHLFRNIYQTENQFSKCIGYITKLTFAMAKGKYIAICEGDDYWTDPLKLQKQVDFLEANPDYAVCFHRVYEQVNKGRLRLSGLNKEKTEQTYTVEQLAKGNFIHTLSAVFRHKLFRELPEQFMNSPALDYVIHLLNATHGKIKYMPEPMAVYRRHKQGIFSQLTVAEQHKKMSKVLSLLLTYNFPPGVQLDLQAQYFQLRENYLLLLLQNEQFETYTGEAKDFFREHPERTTEWIYSRVPEFFKNVARSRTYIFSKRLATVADKLKLFF